MAQSVLLYPPLADFTCAPESAARLKAAAGTGSSGVLAIDLNLRAFADMTSPVRVGEWTNQCEARISALAKRLVLPYWEQQELLTLTESLGDALKARDELGDLAEALRDPERHHQPMAYAAAAKSLAGIGKLLTAVSFPFRFNGLDIRAPFLIYSSAAADRFTAIDPFRPVYDKLLTELHHHKPTTLTIILDEPSQFLPTLSLVTTLKAAFPEASLIVTGALVAQLVRTNEQAAIDLLLQRFSVVIGGDAERHWPEVLAMVESGKWKALPDAHFAAGIKLAARGKTAIAPAVANIPDYSDFVLSDYPSPEPVLAYCPSRGRHFSNGSLNFIDLNQPFVPLAVERVVAELSDLKRRHSLRVFNFAGDWLSIDWLNEFVTAATGSELGLRFGATAIVDRVIDAETAARWKAAGLVTLAVGVNESRDKDISDPRGQDQNVARSLENLAHAGIAVQVSLLLAFPGETEEHARAAVDLLRSRQHEIDLINVGDADLQARPAFAATMLAEGEHFFYNGEQLRCFPELTRQAAGRVRLAPDAERLQLAHAARRWPLSGSVGSAHTLLAFDRHGRRAMVNSAKTASTPMSRPLSEGDRIKLAASTKMMWIPFQLSALREIGLEERELLDHELRRRLRDLGADRVWNYSAREDLRLRAGQRTPHVMAPGLAAAEISVGLADVLSLIGEQFQPVAQLLARVARENRDATKRSLAGLHQQGALLTEVQTRRDQPVHRHQQATNGGGHNAGAHGGQAHANAGGPGGQNNGGPGGGAGRKRRRRRRGRGGEGFKPTNTPPTTTP